MITVLFLSHVMSWKKYACYARFFPTIHLPFSPALFKPSNTLRALILFHGLLFMCCYIPHISRLSYFHLVGTTAIYRELILGCGMCFKGARNLVKVQLMAVFPLVLRPSQQNKAKIIISIITGRVHEDRTPSRSGDSYRN